ncbi:MAG: 3-phosphoshikimate 1-carboxyvinyltransferase [Bacteroidales bacterium]|nr:3-phosphoshikimate 1-carboxyvinyltransferase [Bacteroidales bacterium]
MNRLLLSAPSGISTDILLPASKSICNRVLIIHALSGGKQPLSNLSDCDDTKAMIEALKNRPAIIDIGAAGTAMRFLTAFFSTQSSCHILTGTERMQHRPIASLVDALRSLGANIAYERNQGFPPIRVSGTALCGGEITMPGNVSSQYISALLLIAPTLQNGLNLHLTGNIISRSYINMTISLMKDFGAQASWADQNRIVVKPSTYIDRSYSMESDWSAASYWYEMIALCSVASSVRLTQLSHDSCQGDSRVAAVFEKLGVRTEYTEQGVNLTKVNTVVPYFEDDFSDIPDLAQTVIVTCTLLGIPFRITGLQTLKIKETDRVLALERELYKLGFVLKDEAEGSAMLWDGERSPLVEGAVIDTYEDHRMAMAFAPAALKFGSICIDHPQVVNKSYVGYWNDLRQAGFQMEMV